MARILLGWELGANRGHAVRLAILARSLREHGHDIVFAVSRLDTMRNVKLAGEEIWQAPLSSRLLVGAPPVAGPAAGMGDILARVGFDDSGIVASVVSGWRQLFGVVHPDLVIADFAPFLLLAARGRLPTISVGTGFSTPPSHLAALPALNGGAAGVDQAAVVERVNAALAETGDAPIAGLPEVLAADRPVVATFAELDPYADARLSPLASPDTIDPAAVAGDGDEVFVYFTDRLSAEAPLWRGLAMSGLKVRVHIGLGNEAMRAGVAALGLTVEPAPLPFAQIAARSRVLLSHGGHGFICDGLAAGLPHVVCHYDLEKAWHGLALARAGLGGHVALGAIQPRAFADSLVRVYRDDALTARARAAAQDFRTRNQVPFGEAVLDAVSALI